MGFKVKVGTMSVRQGDTMVPIGVFTGSDAALQQEVSELKEDLNELDERVTSLEQNGTGGSGTVTKTETVNLSEGGSTVINSKASQQTVTPIWRKPVTGGTTVEEDKACNLSQGQSKTLESNTVGGAVNVNWTLAGGGSIAGKSIPNKADTSALPLSIGTGYTQVGTSCLANVIADAYNNKGSLSNGLVLVLLHLTLSDGATITAGTQMDKVVDGVKGGYGFPSSTGWYILARAVSSTNTVNGVYFKSDMENGATVDKIFAIDQAKLIELFGQKYNVAVGTVGNVFLADFPDVEALGSTAGGETYTEMLPSDDGSAKATVSIGSNVTEYTNANNQIVIAPNAVITAVTGGLSFGYKTSTTTSGTEGTAICSVNGVNHTSDETSFTVKGGDAVRAVAGDVTFSYQYTEETSHVAPGGTYPDWSDWTWVCVGDSLTDETINATKKYYRYIAEKTGIKVVVCGVGGTGYARDNTKPYAEATGMYYQRCVGIADKVRSVGGTLDKVVVSVFGSINDWCVTNKYDNRFIGIGVFENYEQAIGTASDTWVDGGTNTLSAHMRHCYDVIWLEIPLVHLFVVNHLYYAGIANQWEHIAKPLCAVCDDMRIKHFDLYHNCSFPIDNNEAFARKYTTDAPATISSNSIFGHPSNAYHEEFLAPYFMKCLREVLPM